MSINQKKHAYMIIAHNEMFLLKQLLESIDDEKNDIYLHIDKKVKDLDIHELKNSVIYSNIYLVKRMKVTWGGDSLVRCEYRLLKEAYKKHYDYYHLLSGVDFPLKSQEYIHDYLARNHGVNFIQVTKKKDGSFDNTTMRNTEYHLFQNLIGRNEELTNLFFRAERHFIKLQRRLGINRLKKCPFTMYKGAQWFSITDDLVEELLDKERFVKKYFFKSYCPDELFVNTVAMNSKNIKVNPDNYLRYIDWDRGQPYIFQLSDYESLVSSDCLFARKFTCETDDGKELIKKLRAYVMRKD